MRFRLKRASDNWMRYNEPYYDRAIEYKFIEDCGITQASSSDLESKENKQLIEKWSLKGYYDFYIGQCGYGGPDAISLRAKKNCNVFFIEVNSMEDLKDIYTTLGSCIVDFDPGKHEETGIEYVGTIQIYDDYLE